MDWKGIIITDGTSQQDRQPAALEPGYFNVDELSFENLLSMGAEFAAGLNYYNLSNKIDGDWGDLFKADEAVAMAAILSTDLDRIESDFLRVSVTSADDLPRFLLELATKINLWFFRLSTCRHKTGEILAHKIATIVSENLAPELHNLGKIADQSLTAGELRDYSEFAAIWGLGSSHGDNPFPRASIVEIEDSDDIERRLSTIFYTFSNSISYLKTSTAILLQQNLDSGQHDPAIGLFMVFLKLYEKAQSKLNRFTPRHLDFYYRQVLRLANRAQIPESYYLLFETRPGAERARIEQGTEFSAGKDAELNEIIYHADHALLPGDARIGSLATLYLQQDKLISPEFELAAVARIKSDLPRLPAMKRKPIRLRDHRHPGPCLVHSSPLPGRQPRRTPGSGFPSPQHAFYCRRANVKSKLESSLSRSPILNSMIRFSSCCIVVRGSCSSFSLASCLHATC